MRDFRSGTRLSGSAFRGVLSPSFATPYENEYGQRTRPGWASRRDRAIDVRIPMFSGTGSRFYGEPSEMDSGFAKLYRDGKLVGKSKQPGRGVFDVTRDSARYRLHVQAKRKRAQWQLSTRAESSWTFSSSSADQGQPLPLMAVQFSPRLDGLNRAPAGRPLMVPIHVRHQPDSTDARVTEVTVQASYDGGQSWEKVSVGPCRQLESPGVEPGERLRVTTGPGEGFRWEHGETDRHARVPGTRLVRPWLGSD